MCPRGVWLRPLVVRLSQARAVALGGLPYPAGELLQTKKGERETELSTSQLRSPCPPASALTR